MRIGFAGSSSYFSANILLSFIKKGYKPLYVYAKKDKKSGILFWLTGLSGSGKTSIGKKIFPYVKKKFGNTIILSGDELRQIFNLNKYDYESRIRYLKFYSNFCKISICCICYGFC